MAITHNHNYGKGLYVARCEFCRYEFPAVYENKAELEHDILADGWRYVGKVNILICDDCVEKRRKEIEEYNLKGFD